MVRIGLPYDGVTAESEWRIGNGSYTDPDVLLSGKKRLALTIKIMTATVEQYKVVERGRLQNRQNHTFDAVYDVVNGEKVNVQIVPGSGVPNGPVHAVQVSGKTTTKVMTRTCFVMGMLGCWQR